MAHTNHLVLRKTGLLLLIVVAACLAAPGPVRAGHTLLEFESALEELWAVDPASNRLRITAAGTLRSGASRAPMAATSASPPIATPTERPARASERDVPGVARARFKVTCLKVMGNHASLGLIPTDAASNDNTMRPYSVSLTAGCLRARATCSVLSPRHACADLCHWLHSHKPIKHGNVVVHDEP